MTPKNDTNLPALFVLDDEPEIVANIVEYLRGCGMPATGYTHPKAALSHLRHVEEPFVLLSDIKMPVMDGLDLVERLSVDHHPKAQFAVVLFTAHGDLDRAVRALRMGVLDFLIKPYELDQLRLAVLRAYDYLDDRIRNEVSAGLSDLARTMASAREVAGLLNTSLSRLEPTAPPAHGGDGISILDSDDYLIACIKWQQSFRRLRDRFFPVCSYDDGAWEILLYVLEQKLLDRRAPVTSACHATALPQTTAMRKVEELVAAGLITKSPDATDRRRVLLAPSKDCLEQSELFFRRAVMEAESILRPKSLDADDDETDAVRPPDRFRSPFYSRSS